MNFSKKIIIIGAGGHAKVLIDILLNTDYELLGIVDHDPLNAKKKVMNIPVIGGDEVIENYSSNEVLLVNGVGSVQIFSSRLKIYEEYCKKGYQFINVLHPRAVISKFSALKMGVQIMAGAIIQPGALIEENVIVNTAASVDHDCIIGPHSHLAPGSILSGGVKIGSNVHVGAGAVIIQNVRIGDNSVIAAGAVVTKDLPEGSRVYGIPARSKENA